MLKELSEPAGAVIYCSRFKVTCTQIISRSFSRTLTEPSTAVRFCCVGHFLPFSVVFSVKKGDPTLSVLELWGAEYQESNALLLRPSDRTFLEKVCQREKCPVDFVGNITGDGKARFWAEIKTGISSNLTPSLWFISLFDLYTDCSGGR